jgi:hypothetical protein
MKINPNIIVSSIEHYANQHFRNENEEIDRMKYKLGAFESQVRHLCKVIDDQNHEINHLNHLLESK